MTTPDRPYANVHANVAERAMVAADRLLLNGANPFTRSTLRMALRAAREAEKVTVEKCLTKRLMNYDDAVDVLRAAGYTVGE